MNNKIYLASRFSRLPELVIYAAELKQSGFEVNSRWLRGGHEWVGTSDDDIPVDANARFAQEDIEDILQADTIICFTEPPGSGPARGGRHFEAGVAYAMGKDIVIVGYRENVFYCLPQMYFFNDWESAKSFVREEL